MTSHFTLMVLTAAALLWLAFVVRRSRIPVRHRWRRRQARTMAEQLRGRDRSQPPQLLYARLRAMDPLAFEELLLESLERRGHKVTRNHRYTGDGGIDGQVVIEGAIWLIQAKRYATRVLFGPIMSLPSRRCASPADAAACSFIRDGPASKPKGCESLRRCPDHFRTRAAGSAQR